jgi:hypothetical protein
VLCDFHVHLYDDEPDYAEALAETAKNLGFDKLCIGGGEARFGLASNQKVLRQAELYPDLFIPFAFVRLGVDSPQVVEELSRFGFRGLKVAAPPAPYDDPGFYPVYEAAQGLGMPVVFHTGFVPPSPMDRALDVRSHHMKPVYLDTLARRFRELKIIGSGLGGPWYEEASEVLCHHNNVHFDLSGPTLRKKELPFFRSLLGGPANAMFEGHPGGLLWSKIIFGSAVRHEEVASLERDYQRLFRSLSLPEDVIQGIMGETAARLLGLGSEVS